MAGLRPGSVTAVGVVIIIFGILNVINGILGIFRNGFGGFLGGLLTIVVGVIYLAVAKGIFDGNNFSRLLVAIFTVINLIAGVWALFFTSFSYGIVQIIVSVVILVLLYNKRASLFFAVV